MEQTEVMLREEVREMITDKAPVEQIEQQINMIIANLAENTASFATVARNDKEVTEEHLLLFLFFMFIYF